MTTTTIKPSIKIKKFWYAEPASDGGIGTSWNEVQLGQREATVQFVGSDADTTNYKNVVGGVIESANTKGDKTVSFQLADLTPDVVATFSGGTATSSAAAISYDAPENENQSIELSIMFLTERNVLFRLPRVIFDGYPSVSDDDLHYYQINGVVGTPTKSGVTSYGYDILLKPDENDITAFVLEKQIGAAVINATSHTVSIEVANGTAVTALKPTITPSLGASLSPGSGVAQDFTNPVVYTVTSANGVAQAWTVTVTEASE